MSKRFPDLEIYIKRVDPESVTGWLESNFKLVSTRKDKNSVNCDLLSRDESEMECVILEKAAKGGYLSVWFKQNKTEWDTDRQCAEAAFSYFKCRTGTEIRCSTGGWEGEDEAGWFRFTEEGIQQVNWF